MNTIIYLGSIKALHDFDWMQEENILHKQVKEKLTELEFSNLVKTDLRNAKNLDYLIIDACILEKNSLNSYKQGIETFQVLNPSCQIILYAHEEIIVQDELQGVVVINEPGQALEQKDMSGQIVEKEQFDIPEKNIDEERENVREENVSTESATEILNNGVNEVSESEIPTEPLIQVQDEENKNSLDIFSRMNVKVKTSEGIPLKERCLEQQKVTEKENIQLNNLTTLNNIWTCSNVIIAVTGSQRRTGATTVAMRLCDYLNKNGAHVCYSEATLNKHLSNIAEEFNFDAVEGSYRKDNITYYRDSAYDTEAGYNFIVLDLGAIEERPKWIVAVIEKVADEVILVANGARNYEVETLNRSLEVLSGTPVRINVVINSISESRFKVFTEQNEDDRVLFKRGDYETGFFNTTRVEEELAVLLKAHNV